MREADNIVTIEGLLLENKLEEADYKKMDGSEHHCIRGDIIVRTTIKIDGKDTTVEIPISFFTNQLKNDGSPNKLYGSRESLMNTYKSAAAVGVDEADYISVTGKLQMNDYPTPDGTIVSYPRIQGNFFKKLTRENCQPQANFEIAFVVANISPEFDFEGDETGSLLIKGVVPQFGNKVDVVTFKASNPNVIDVISDSWEEGKTVKAIGKINFSVEAVSKTVESDFGEPQENHYTKKVRDLIITGGRREPLDGEFAYDPEEISTALAERKVALDEKKAKATSKSATKNTPVASKNGMFNLGF